MVSPGVTYLVTRRCSERRFFLRPSETVTEVFLYALAVAARRSGVLVHAFCVMSNHIHIVLTDPDARLPLFSQFLNAMIARSMNAALGRWESFWDPRRFSAVTLVAPGDIVNETAYTLANPVAEGLVRRARMWPGAWSEPERIGSGPIMVSRPNHFFSKKGSLPANIELELTVPPGFASAEEFREQVLADLASREEEAAKKFGNRFIGVAKVLAQKPSTRPASLEPRRTLSPKVAARDPWTRIEALRRLKEFVDDYRVALEAWRSGDRKAYFPPGTYLMRVLHGAPCAAAG